MAGLTSGLYSDPGLSSILGPASPPPQSTSTPLPAQSKPGKYDDVLQDVATEYPALAPHVAKAHVYDSTPSKGNEDSGLETYLPWEDWNPHPGKITQEIYKPFANREDAKNALAGDLIHMAGAVDPTTKKPVDPKYYELKKQVQRARSIEQINIDRKAYKDAKEDRPFGEWLQDSRLESYVRGRLFPDKNDEWKKFYDENPKLKKAVDKIGKYLRTPNASNTQTPK